MLICIFVFFGRTAIRGRPINKRSHTVHPPNYDERHIRQHRHRIPIMMRLFQLLVREMHACTGDKGMRYTYAMMQAPGCQPGWTGQLVCLRIFDDSLNLYVRAHTRRIRTPSTSHRMLRYEHNHYEPLNIHSRAGGMFFHHRSPLPPSLSSAPMNDDTMHIIYSYSYMPRMRLWSWQWRVTMCSARAACAA